MSADFRSLRQEFPLLAEKTYLNSGSYGALADSVRASFLAYLDDRLAAGADWALWETKTEAVRMAIARLLGADPFEIAVTASASAGINALASALDFTGRRNKVVVSDFEFPTNAQIWHAQEPRGAKVVHVACDSTGEIPLERFERAIDEQTQLVAVTHVCFRNGAKLDIEGIVRRARDVGAKVLLDGYQSIGSIGVDVKSLDVDFAVGGMLKYLLGTAGVGFLYVRRGLIGRLVPTQSGWFAQEDIAAMAIHENHPAASARRFEAGTPPVVNCYAAEAGLTTILRVGLDVIEDRIVRLTTRCLERLEEIGWPSATPAPATRRGAMVAIPAQRSRDVVAALGARGIVTSHRNDNVRATFHYYNNEDDVETLILALADLRTEFFYEPIQAQISSS